MKRIMLLLTFVWGMSSTAVLASSHESKVPAQSTLREVFLYLCPIVGPHFSPFIGEPIQSHVGYVTNPLEVATLKDLTVTLNPGDELCIAYPEEGDSREALLFRWSDGTLGLSSSWKEKISQTVPINYAIPEAKQEIKLKEIEWPDAGMIRQWQGWRTQCASAPEITFTELFRYIEKHIGNVYLFTGEVSWPRSYIDEEWDLPFYEYMLSITNRNGWWLDQIRVYHVDTPLLTGGGSPRWQSNDLVQFCGAVVGWEDERLEDEPAVLLVESSGWIE